jgi:hypothetical protein
MATYYNITEQEMTRFLESQGFQRIQLQGYQELVWAKRVDQGNLALSLRVCSGINPDGNSRDVGKDAIRVELHLGTMVDGKQQIRRVRAGKRVHRVLGWRKNLQQRIDKWTADHLHLCPKCGMPTTLRKGKKGEFVGCMGYPACKHTENI